MTEKRYLVLIPIGYGHEEPEFFKSKPEEALETAYDIYINHEQTEYLLSDAPEDIKIPLVLEVSELTKDSKLFVSMVKQKQEDYDLKMKALREADQASLELRKQIANKLTEEECKALGLK